jgi:hypothetical protein
MVLWWIALPAGPAIGWKVFLRWPALHPGKRRSLVMLFLTAAAIAPLTTITSWSFRNDWLAAGFLMSAWSSAWDSSPSHVRLKSSRFRLPGHPRLPSSW